MISNNRIVARAYTSIGGEPWERIVFQDGSRIYVLAWDVVTGVLSWKGKGNWSYAITDTDSREIISILGSENAGEPGIWLADLLYVIAENMAYASDDITSEYDNYPDDDYYGDDYEDDPHYYEGPDSDLHNEY